MMPALILPFAETDPTFAGPPTFAGSRSAVLGRATIGTGAWLGASSVVRADGNVVRLGDDVHLGPRATVHIVHDRLPALVGHNVTAGENTVIHACTVGDDCVFERDVVVLDGARVDAGVLIEACATVFPRKVLESGWIYAGSPAKPVRELAPGELAERRAAIRARDGSAVRPALPDGPPPPLGEDVFVANTARWSGRVSFAAGSSLFFSCVADAGSGSIAVGENTNVQDNTIIRAGTGEALIGRDVTIGHNVQIGAARIGSRTLIGMGAHIADGVRVEDDVLLAAGTMTEPRQVIESGWLWGGRPAKKLSPMDAPRRDGMREIIEEYRGYGRTYARLQRVSSARD